MIFPKVTQTVAAVALHYDELGGFYREIWGDHVHHGYWSTGRETPEQAAEALIEIVAEQLRLSPGLDVCDIGCGYGETARALAERYDVSVTGFTVSESQSTRARAIVPQRGALSILCRDWLDNRLPGSQFDRAYAIESSEHMISKEQFFSEAFRHLRPGGAFVVCAWLSRTDPKPWEVTHLLEPICREGRLPSMGDEGDYRRFAEQAGFQVVDVVEISDRVSRTWWICVRRALGKVFTSARYGKFLLNREASNRIFAITLVRIMIAYWTGSMRYCLFVFQR